MSSGLHVPTIGDAVSGGDLCATMMVTRREQDVSLDVTILLEEWRHIRLQQGKGSYQRTNAFRTESGQEHAKLANVREKEGEARREAVTLSTCVSIA